MKRKVLILMILFDFLLHLFELGGVIFFYFPNRGVYTVFWTLFWGIGLVLSISLYTSST